MKKIQQCFFLLIGIASFFLTAQRAKVCVVRKYFGVLLMCLTIIIIGVGVVVLMTIEYE